MDIQQASEELREKHYCHLADFGEGIQVGSAEAQSFRGYWSNLVRDEAYKAYTHRERRILRYHLLPGGRLRLNKDVDFISPVIYPVDYRKGVNVLSYAEEGFISHAITRQILAVDIGMAVAQFGDRAYSIDVHQFRVKADDNVCSPTTSGIHQDGLDWVSMHFIGTANAQPVLSEVYASDDAQSRVLSVRLEKFLDTLVVHDRMVYHRAGEVRQVNGAVSAWRDMLVVGMRCLPDDLGGDVP